MRHHALRRCVTAAVAVAGILATTACASTTSTSAGSATSATRTDWPQPENGTLTADMCEVLTTDDLTGNGVADETTTALGSRVVPEAGPNVVDCRWGGKESVELTLNMQPDVASAALLQQSELADHRGSGATDDLRENALAGADESWYDTTAADGTHELHARRDRLLVTVALAATDTTADRLPAASALAGLVYSRLPSVGLAADSTGKPHEMVLTLTGSVKGPVDVTYHDPVSGRDVRETGAALPYSKTITFPWYGTAGRPVKLSATAEQPSDKDTIGCTLEVDAESVATAGPTAEPDCSGTYSDPS